MRLHACSAALLAALAPAAAGQGFQFDALQSQSNYTWTGQTSLGQLVGDPNNHFQLAGTVELALDAGGNPVASGQWLGTDLLVVPNLAGHIPNPLVFLPPLAQLTVNGMRFSIASGPFTVQPDGSFSTTTVLTVTSGVLTVTPLTGSATVTDLAGTLGPPTVTTGTITESGGTLTMVSPMVTNFQFTDPTSNISATINLNGTLVAEYACPAPQSYCTGAPNSVGPGAAISALGSTSVTANALTLRSVGNPAGKPGLFFFGLNQSAVPLGNGLLCATGQVRRLGVVISNPAGEYQQALDLTSLPGGAVIGAGDTRNFQCWYRDPAAGGAGFNLSDGVSVVFCP